MISPGLASGRGDTSAPRSSDPLLTRALVRAPDALAGRPRLVRSGGLEMAGEMAVLATPGCDRLLPRAPAPPEDAREDGRDREEALDVRAARAPRLEGGRGASAPEGRPRGVLQGDVKLGRSEVASPRR